MSLETLQPPLAATDWRVWRIVPSRYPPISVFDRVSNAGDLEAIFAIESMTNSRLREEAGDLQLVSPADRVSGPGTTPIMAAFTHLNPDGARFTDSTYGAYYAARDLETAIAETKYHREQFLEATQRRPLTIDQRVYVSLLRGELHDLRPLRDTYPAILDPQSYAASQTLGRRLRNTGSNGLIYPSVRHPGGTCVAVFRPRLLSGCKQERHLAYHWDGNRIDAVYEKSDLRTF